MLFKKHKRRNSSVYIVMMETYLNFDPETIMITVDDVYRNKDKAKNRIVQLTTKGYLRPLIIKHAWIETRALY